MNKPITLDVNIGGRSYRFAAPADQAERLQQLAARVDALLNAMKQAEPNADRDRHLMLACLTLASDVAEGDSRLDDQASAVTQFHRQLTERLSTLLPST